MKIAIFLLTVCFNIIILPSSFAKLKIISKKADPFARVSEVNEVLDILNCLFNNVDRQNGVSLTADGDGNVSLMGTPTGGVGMRIQGIIEDAMNTVELHLESSTTSYVLIGGWRRGDPNPRDCVSMPGDGKQSIDLGDLKKVPSYKTQGVNKCVASREALLYHELIEAYEGVRSGYTYEKAHEEAVKAEAEVLQQLHLQPDKKRTGDRSQVMGDSLCVWLYYKDTKDSKAKTNALKFTMHKNTGGMNNVKNFESVSRTRRISFNGCGDGFCFLDKSENGMPVYDSIPNSSEFDPTYFASGPDDQLLVSDPSSMSAYLMDYSGNIISVFAHPDMISPAGNAFKASTAEVFVVDDSEEKVFVFGVDGTHHRTLVNAAISIPAELDFNSQGDVIISNHGNDNILTIDDSTGALMKTIAHDSLETPAGMKYDIFTDQLYVVDNNRGRVVQFDYTSGNYLGVFASGSQLQSPWGLDLLGGDVNDFLSGISGNLVTEVAVASQGNQSIITFDTAGVMKDSFSQPGINVYDLIISEFPDSLSTPCLLSLVLSHTTLMNSEIAVQNSLFIQDSVQIGANQNVVLKAGSSIEFEHEFEVPVSAVFQFEIEELICPDP